MMIPCMPTLCKNGSVPTPGPFFISNCINSNLDTKGIVFLTPLIPLAFLTLQQFPKVLEKVRIKM